MIEKPPTTALVSGDGAVSDRAVGGHDARLLAQDPAAEDPRPRLLDLPDHRVRRLTDRRPVLLGDVVHRSVVKRDQVARHVRVSLSERGWKVMMLPANGSTA